MAEPKYRQIAEELRGRIESGELPGGSQLPTEIELQEQFDASRNTVRDAVRWLITRRLVETRPGQGTFVPEKITPYITTLTGPPGGHGGRGYVAEVAASRRQAETSEPRVEIQQADHSVARNLRIAEGAQVVCRHQMRFIDGTPWSLQTSYYPMTLVTHGAANLLLATRLEGGAVGYVARSCGIEQVGYRDTIAVRRPSEVEARFFRLPADGRVPVIEVFRVGFDRNAERIRLTVTVYPCDRNLLRVDVGGIPPGELAELGAAAQAAP